jgi:ionotropic kainate glutamate receptor 2
MDLVNAWGWKKFTVLYEDTPGLVRLGSLLTMFDKKDKPVTVRQLAAHKNHRQILRDMRNAGERHIILDCSIETLPEVLKQAQQVGLMTSDQSYIITSLVSHMSGISRSHITLLLSSPSLL